MLVRILTGAALVAGLVALCIFSNTIAFPIVLGLCALLGTYEMLGCLRLRKNFVISISLYTLCVVTTVLSCTVQSQTLFILAYCSILFFILLLLLGAAVFSNGSLPIDKVCVSFTTCAYIITGFTSLVLLRYLTAGNVEIGKYIYILAFIGPWITDTFAYFTGMLFGRHKLIPEVSPKKTIEGSVGGTVFCIACVSLYGYLVNKYLAGGILPPVYVFSIIGLVVSLVSQVGDLIFSLIKRKYGIKDYGFIFPGHGGVLDRFDSIIATAPLILIVCAAMIALKLI